MIIRLSVPTDHDQRQTELLIEISPKPTPSVKIRDHMYLPRIYVECKENQEMDTNIADVSCNQRIII